MPYSSLAGKRFIEDIVKSLKHKKILDIGCGSGTYAKMFPESEVTGVEIWEPYVDRFRLDSWYKKLYIEDVRTWAPEGYYDIVIVGDILEHMTLEEAKAVFDKLRPIADTVIVSIPIGKWPQDAKENNPYEAHVKDDWSRDEVHSVFGEPTWGRIEQEVGVFVWSKFPIELEPDAIPKVIHIVWIGDESKRPDNCINTWRELNPTWEVKIWGNKEYEETDWFNKHLMEHMWKERGLFYGVADMMRYEILYNHGGFCVDADSRCVRPLEDWLFDCAEVITVYENEKVQPGLAAVGFMASIPKHPIWKELMYIIHFDPKVKHLEPWRVTGQQRFTHVIDHTYNLNIKIWPSYTFLPVHCTGETYTGDGPIFANHDWGSTHDLYDELHKKDFNKKLKIAIYTICKNEAHYVDRWAATNGNADLRIVCDTGSTDNTVELLKNHNVTVYNIAVKPWRFDTARNTALNLVPDDVDICIWQDLDEELLPGWREELEAAWKDNTVIANHRYRHNDGVWQWHSKIHARHNCIWTGPVHESLSWASEEFDDPNRVIWLQNVWLDEHQNVTKDRKSYLHLMEKKVTEGVKDWKTYYFLAIEYQKVAQPLKAIETYKNAYDICPKTDLVDLSYISKTIANVYAEVSDRDEAEKWFKVSTSHGNERESWFSFTEYCYNIQDWDNCYMAAKKCLNVNVKRDGYTQDPRAWSFLVYDYAAIAAHNLDMPKQAIMYGEKAIELNPEDARLKTNLEFYKERL
jgi:mannosyltransferase OCH1-like enzyme/tetratricopeptide (TPR) repeat protein